MRKTEHSALLLWLGFPNLGSVCLRESVDSENNPFNDVTEIPLMTLQSSIKRRPTGSSFLQGPQV